MIELKKKLIKATTYQPFFKYLLGLEDEAWILAYLFMQNGFVTRNKIIKELDLNPITFSDKLNYLAEMGYIQINKEFSPHRLTLRIKFKEIEDQLIKNEKAFENVEILNTELGEHQQIIDKYSKAFRSLLCYTPHKEMLANILTYCYLFREKDHYTMTLSELRDILSNEDLVGQEELKRIVENSELLDTFTVRISSTSEKTSKRPKSSKVQELFIRPCYTLSMTQMGEFLLLRVKWQHKRHLEKASELREFIRNRYPTRENISITNRALKRRIHACLGVSDYKIVRVIDNGILSSRSSSKIELLDLIPDNMPEKQFFILTSREDIPGLDRLAKKEIKIFPTNIPPILYQEYQTRDMIIFDKGILIIPLTLPPFYIMEYDTVVTIIENFDSLFNI
ncbi:MAG: hypothetical protein ACFFBD_28935 [Candidatus Hodarchaeota archaeon]